MREERVKKVQEMMESGVEGLAAKIDVLGVDKKISDGEMGVDEMEIGLVTRDGQMAIDEMEVDI